MTLVCKKLKLQSHETGDDCNCKRLKCFQQIGEQERRFLISSFNLLRDNNEQNSHLASLISLQNIQQRRPRQDEDIASLHDCAYGYRVRVKRNEKIEEVPVCAKAFASIHGVTKGKIEYIQKSLKSIGQSPKDARGTHTNRPRKISEPILDKIDTHIKSFKGRASHYSIKKSSKIYLPEELNVTKMFNMFKQVNPDVTISYETYRTIFKTFNASFGYPRSDTCSICDKFLAEMKSLEKQAKSAEAEKRNLKVLNDIHKTRAHAFYTLKKNAKAKAKSDITFEAIAMDFQKNVPLPNITTNDVYYKRQLSMYSFNIHVLSTGKSAFYTYPETVAKKGSNDVVSFLHHFVYNILDQRVRHFEIFCDSAGGQNKNYLVFKFIHYLVYYRKRFDSIKITFPIRGHSYMECDKNFGIINLKTKMETPTEWYSLLRTSRIKPEPFIVIEVDQNMVRDWSSLLNINLRYLPKCPFKIQELREIAAEANHPRMLIHRSSYYGGKETSVVTTRASGSEPELNDNEFHYPHQAYKGTYPVLLIFCHSKINFFRSVASSSYEVQKFTRSKTILWSRGQKIF